MARNADIKVELWGAFRVRDGRGEDCTPRGMKERALLALVLMSEGQRRPRVWLQEKLWSDSDPGAAATSFRRALANIRKDIGPINDCLRSDSQAVWFSPPVALERARPALGDAEFLGDLDVPDREFEDWLRDRRAEFSGQATSHPHPPTPSRRAGRQSVAIQVTPEPEASHTRFLTSSLVQRIAGQLPEIGPIDVFAWPDSAEGDTDFTFTIESHEDRDRWYMMLRLLAGAQRRTLWSQRIVESRDIGSVWDSPAITRLANRAIAELSDQTALAAKPQGFAALQMAVRRIYDFRQAGLDSADALLQRGDMHEAEGLALAWRAFARLTSILEFRADPGPKTEEALEFCAEAIALMPNNPVVLALAAQVYMKLTGDFGYGHHLASRAVTSNDQNIYALDALSLSLFFRGEYTASYQVAEQARVAADGLAHSFSWDMQSCLSALSLGKLDRAAEMAEICNRKMPEYRPALRYLSALNYLIGDRTKAAHYSARLKRLEPDFRPELMLQPDYPLETLRKLGLVEDLRNRIL